MPATTATPPALAAPRWRLSPAALAAGLALCSGPALAQADAETAAAGTATATAVATATPAAATPTVVVTASRLPMLAVDAPASLSVVSGADIEARGADNVLDAVRLSTGLTLQGRAVGGRQVLGLRGLDARHTLYLLDGQRVAASDGVVGASDFQYDWLSAADMARIEVVRGPLSVLYGSEALGGVVNVITREPQDRWQGSVLSEGSLAEGGRGGDGWRASLSAMGPLGGGLALKVGAAARSLEPLASPVDPRLSELEGREKREGWLGLVWRDAAQTWRLDHRQAQETRQAAARERGGRRRYHESYNDIDRSTDSLAWEQAGPSDPAGQPAWQTQLRLHQARLDVVNRRTEGVSVNAPQQLTDSVFDGQASLQQGPHGLLAGFELRQEVLRDPGLPDGRSEGRHRAVFVQDEWRPLDSLALTAGLRHERHDAMGEQWSPRLYAVWHWAPRWTLKGGYSQGFKTPNLKQVVPGPRAEGPNTVIGNPDLKPEVAHGVELGIGHEQGARQVQLVAFSQQVRDLIELRLVRAGPVPGTGTYVYGNLARARLQGLELDWVEPLAPGWALGTALSWLDAHDGDGERLDRRPRLSGSLRLDGRQGPWRAGLHLAHTGRQWLPSASVGQPSQPVPSVNLLGAYVGWAWPAGLELRLGVQNLGDLRLADHSPLFTQVEPPRQWRLALQGRW